MQRIDILKILFFTCCLFAAGFLLPAPGRCGTEVVVIPIEHRNGAELVSIVEHLLSPEGRVGHDPRTNSLIIIDRFEHLQNIRVVLDRTDVPTPQVRVRVRFHQAGIDAVRGGSVDGRVSGDNWSVGIGDARRSGVRAHVRNDRSREAIRSEYMIRTASGGSAYILAGKEIPFRSEWRSICRRYPVCSNGVEFRSIETGFEVTPVVRGERVEVDIIPRISGMGPAGELSVVRFTEASTRLTATLGEWVTVGEWEAKKDGIYRAILESISRRREETLAISLRVDRTG